MSELSRMEKAADLEEFVYHLRGILEAGDVIREQAKALDQAFDIDTETAADILGRLRAELYFHLPYHMKELRKPFLRMRQKLGQKGGPHSGMPLNDQT
jgi:hypothetical protein